MLPYFSMLDRLEHWSLCHYTLPQKITNKMSLAKLESGPEQSPTVMFGENKTNVNKAIIGVS